MRTMGMSVRRFVLAMVPLAILTLGGCQYSLVGEDPTSYQVYEEGKLLALHAVAIEFNTCFPAPSNFHVVLTEKLPSGHNPFEIMALYYSPPERSPLGEYGEYGDLCEQVDELTYDVDRGAIRWIISLKPLVVGIGRTDPRPRMGGGVALGLTFHSWGFPKGEKMVVLAGTTALIREENGDEPVSMLMVSDHPVPARIEAGMRVHEGGRKRIVLREPATLRQVLKTQPWRDSAATQEQRVGE